MSGPLVVLTGASGAGKTTVARCVEQMNLPNCRVLFFDSIGVPSTEEMMKYGTGHQPGGAWQRAVTLQWMVRIRSILEAGTSVLFEGQMRITFIKEGLMSAGIDHARVILVDCGDDVRVERLSIDRSQPELANMDMMNWARFLRNEALEEGIEIIDTGRTSFSTCVNKIAGSL